MEGTLRTREEALLQLQAPEDVRARIKKEISRFKTLMPSSSEGAVERGYIETLLELPWDKASEDNESMQRAREILERTEMAAAKMGKEYLSLTVASVNTAAISLYKSTGFESKGMISRWYVAEDGRDREPLQHS